MFPIKKNEMNENYSQRELTKKGNISSLTELLPDSIDKRTEKRKWEVQEEKLSEKFR